jgi:rubrerythrin
MGMLVTQRFEVLLDRMVREKDISATFFTNTAEILEDPDQRRWFRRMGQDEKDQRKILMKHRRELCEEVDLGEPTAVSPVHRVLARPSTLVGLEYLGALRLAVRSAEETRDLCAQASDVTPDRSCRIFLKILSQESEVHRKALLEELRRVERERLDSAEERAA